ncbi:hypothetical protein V6N13_059774 [Hibiscus sabdariffa]
MASALAGDDLARSMSSRRSWAASTASIREVWQSSPDVFNRSGRQDDDEEELRWAAIERLPTYDRLRKGMLRQVLDNGKVVHDEVDVTKLGVQDKKQLMDSMLRVIEEDNGKFLRRLRDRTDRVGIEIPTIEVRFERLEVEGDVHVGSRALPTLLNVTLNTIESILGLVGLAPSKKRKIQILKDVSGIVKPSRMTLLLGPPGAGKSTLLMALAGKLDCDLRSSGKVTYCGHEFSEFVPQRTCAYISQHDLHYGEMTVRETLDFSGRCLGVGTRYEMLSELSRREKEVGIKPDSEIDAFMKATAVAGQETSLVTDYILKILGLDICADIVVGDDMRRGISGGQKKRVTTGEIIPLSFMESGIWIALTYYTIGFAPAAGRFFRQFLAFFGIHQMALSLFRFIAAAARTQVVANTVGTFTLLLVFVLGGFIVAKNDIDPWMIWGYYVSPMMYGQNAIVMNEFLDDRWSANNTDPRIDAPTVGKVLLKTRGFYTEEYWFWICVGALFAFSLVFNILFIGALTFMNPSSDSKAVVVDDEEEKKNTKNPYAGGSIPEDTLLKARNISNSHKKGMILPFQPLSLAFNHVNYYVDMPPEMKTQGIEEDRLQLLRDVSGAFRPGILTALVGVSGAAWLRLASNIDTKTRKMFVDEVMELVELKPLRNALVGLPGVDGLSTEQRKRLTIAVELVANPSIIFMDEPTSGLDARAAAIVMRTVRNTVDTGRTVVCTIHQPSIDIFEAFDELLLMKRGGQVIYAGPLGRHSHKLIEYFEAVQGVPKIGHGYNPATWMLEVSAPSVEAKLNVDFADIYTNSSLYRMNQELIKDLRQKISRQQELMNLLGAMYSAVLFLGATNASAVQSVVAIERTVFYRERAAGMYSELPYAFAQVAIETIYTAIQTLIYTLLLYSMIGFEWTPAKFFCFWNLFSGFLIPRTQIPIWWRWYYWASPVAWTLYGLVTSQVGDKDAPLEVPGQQNMTLKIFLKENLGFEHSFLPVVAVAHVGWCLLFFFVFAYGIRFLNFQKR